MKIAWKILCVTIMLTAIFAMTKHQYASAVQQNYVAESYCRNDLKCTTVEFTGFEIKREMGLELYVVTPPNLVCNYADSTTKIEICSKTSEKGAICYYQPEQGKCHGNYFDLVTLIIEDCYSTYKNCKQ